MDGCDDDNDNDNDNDEMLSWTRDNMQQTSFTISRN